MSAREVIQPNILQCMLEREVNQPNIYRILPGHLHLGHNLCAKYHDPSSNLLTKSFVG